jgi:hypothetical protein
VVVLALAVFGGCSSSSDKPVPSTAAVTSTTTVGDRLASMILSWCITATSSADARTQAAEAGLTPAQIDLVVDELERMKASTDQC